MKPLTKQNRGKVACIFRKILSGERSKGDLVDLEKMLQNEYLDARIGVDTEENEPSEVRVPNRS